MSRLIPALLLAVSVAAMGRQPRFLGPPVKKPPDAGAADAGAADAGAVRGEADPPLLKAGDDAPMFDAVLHNPEAAGAQHVDLSNLVGPDAIDKDESLWPQIAELVKANHVTFPVVKAPREGKVAMVKQGYPDDAAGFLRAEVERVLQ